ncbi:GNAT family N-acetyltransferase [Laspinema olomoucense]|uniref:GNAT family N-acetyltransferase n=1 Tax=Laspinema olomoucense TaxID=3231600 RepID=UPI0021BADD7F|nr:GNAT family N-acetyltransferase [Laspinema sp. D3a]MCT7989046.1 GNAT family N-acetyltransferase [Laspinema sp. D3a]
MGRGVIQLGSIECGKRSYAGGNRLEELVALYRAVFAEPPSSQWWSKESVVAMFECYFQTGSVLGAFSSEGLVGFAVVQPLASASIIGQPTWIEVEQRWRSLDWQLLDEFGLLPHCGYLADLGVAASHRRQGIGAELVRLGCQQYSDKPMLLRVSACKSEAIALYLKLGFARIPGLEQRPEYRQQDGSLKTEPKFLMLKDTTSLSGY